MIEAETGNVRAWLRPAAASRSSWLRQRVLAPCVEEPQEFGRSQSERFSRNHLWTYRTPLRTAVRFAGSAPANEQLARSRCTRRRCNAKTVSMRPGDPLFPPTAAKTQGVADQEQGHQPVPHNAERDRTDRHSDHSQHDELSAHVGDVENDEAQRECERRSQNARGEGPLAPRAATRPWETALRLHQRTTFDA